MSIDTDRIRRRTFLSLPLDSILITECKRVTRPPPASQLELHTVVPLLSAAPENTFNHRIPRRTQALEVGSKNYI